MGKGSILLCKSVDTRILGLQKKENEAVLDQGSSFDDLSTITSLEEELSQSDRFMENEGA